MRDEMSMSKGMVSAGYTQAYDTIATRRSLDTSGRVHGEGRPELPPTFVRTGYLPSGFSHDVKLHTNTCMTDGLMSLQSDPVRWQGRLGIGRTLYSGVLAPQPEPKDERVSTGTPSGYSRIRVWSDAVAAGGVTPPPQAASMPLTPWRTMPTTIPSGYSLNRKTCGLAELESEGESAAARFAPPTTSARAATAGVVEPTKVSSYSRSVVSADRIAMAPYGTQAATNLLLPPPFCSPGGPLHPANVQARLRQFRAPAEIDPHWHKRRRA